MLGGCGLTADFGGLQGGTRDAGATDAALSFDAEAGAPLDSSAEASGGFCVSRATTHQLCADFDEGAPVDTGWTLRDATPNATVAVDAIGFSPPGSMLSAIGPGDVPASARLQQAVPVLSTKVHIEFQMLLATGGGPFELCALHEVAPDGTSYGFFYKQEQGDLLVYVGTLGADGGLTQLVYRLGAPPSTWLHVEIDLTLGDAGSVRVKHDGSVVVDAPSVPTATAGRKQLFVELGFFSPGSATAHADFDDVLVDWQ